MSDTTTIFLAHLLKNSIKVNAGQIVKTGEPLAKVGNSGSSTEPHLHIHAMNKFLKNDFLFKGSGRPIIFNNRYLVRNDIFEN